VPDVKSNFLEANNISFRLSSTVSGRAARRLDCKKLDENSGTRINVVFLDWAKAFDRVDHQRLLSSCRSTA
jgi:hypothetical protein